MSHDSPHSSPTVTTIRRWLGAEIPPILVLAVPVMGARAGLVVMISVNSMMVGHSGADELAYFAIATSIEVAALAIGHGLMNGIAILVARARGAGRNRECGRIGQSAFVLSIAVALCLFTVLSFGETLLLLLGQSPDIAAGGGAVLAVARWGMLAVPPEIALVFFLEGLGRAVPGMVAIWAGVAVLPVLGWFLVLGHAGGPVLGIEGGAEGAALAMALIRWIMLFGLLAYIGLTSINRTYAVYRLRRTPFLWVGRLLRLGGPIGLAQASESGAFLMMAMFAGWLGAVPLATYQIVINLLALIFMIALGAGTAATVRVSAAIGAAEHRPLSRIGGAAIVLIVAMMMVAGMVIGIGHGWVARLYSTDAVVLQAAAVALPIAAIIVVPDGLQGVIAGALRGAADVTVPTVLHLTSFWVITIPLCWWLGIEQEGGLAGLLLGLLAGLMTASVLLGLRMYWIAHHRLKALERMPLVPERDGGM